MDNGLQSAEDLYTWFQVWLSHSAAVSDASGSLGFPSVLLCLFP